MDFKVVGTAEGISSLQMDIKIEGINERFNVEFAEASDAVMGEAKLLQTRVESLVGNEVDNDVVFDDD